MTIFTEEQKKAIQEKYQELEAKAKEFGNQAKDFALVVEEEVKGPNFKTAAGTYLIGKSVSLAVENVVKSGTLLFTPNPVLPMFGMFAGGVALLGLAQKQRKVVREVRKLEYAGLLKGYVEELQIVNKKLDHLELLRKAANQKTK